MKILPNRMVKGSSFFAILLLLSAFRPPPGTEKANNRLSSEFHKNRRAIFAQQLPANSMAILFSNPVRNRSNDVDYVYHQDPDFYYLTGLKEPNSILVIYSEPQKNELGKAVQEMVFVQPKDEKAELWNGKRLGVKGVKEELGFEHVLTNQQFRAFNLQLEKKDKILFLDFKGDIRDNATDEADLFSLVEQFKAKISYPVGYSSERFKLYDYIKSQQGATSANVANIIGKQLAASPLLRIDPYLKNYLKADSEKARKKAISAFPESNLDGYSLNYLLNALREIKQPEEIALLRKAIDISCVAQVEVMKAMRPDMSETEVQGIHEFVFKKYGSESEGYPSIVGAGHNGCVLHYIENNRPTLGNDLVLMDLGAQYRGYTADVTRTIPANGTFSEEQRTIYEIVLEAQEAAFEQCRPGAGFFAPFEATGEIIGQRLYELGILKHPEMFRTYLPHGISHYIGLDVHDRGNYGPLQPNQVITIEPGIYIPEGSDCDPKWWGIAIRIEDDLLITDTGHELLSGYAPRTVAGIEAMMALPSPLDAFVLPSLEEISKQ